MNPKTYRLIRVAVAFFIGMIVSIASVKESYLLASSGVITGIIFMVFARRKAKILTDERDQTIQDKAARLTYAIFAPTLGLASFFLLLPPKGNLSVFAKGEWLFTESLGMIFAYLSLFLVAIYALTYYYYSRRFGGGSDAE